MVEKKMATPKKKVLPKKTANPETEAVAPPEPIQDAIQPDQVIHPCKIGQPPIEERVARAINNSEIPQLYANSFVCARGFGDVFCVLEKNGNAQAILNMSYTVAKTLSLKLKALIKELETATGNIIMTTTDVEEKMKEKEVADEPNPAET